MRSFIGNLESSYVDDLCKHALVAIRNSSLIQDYEEVERGSYFYECRAHTDQGIARVALNASCAVKGVNDLKKADFLRLRITNEDEGFQLDASRDFEGASILMVSFHGLTAAIRHASEDDLVAMSTVLSRMMNNN